jgi:hypothetical protein
MPHEKEEKTMVFTLPPIEVSKPTLGTYDPKQQPKPELKSED